MNICSRLQYLFMPGESRLPFCQHICERSDRLLQNSFLHSHFLLKLLKCSQSTLNGRSCSSESINNRWDISLVIENMGSFQEAMSSCRNAIVSSLIKLHNTAERCGWIHIIIKVFVQCLTSINKHQCGRFISRDIQTVPNVRSYCTWQCYLIQYMLTCSLDSKAWRVRR